MTDTGTIPESSGKATAHPSECGWICNLCGNGVFEGCGCDHGEWECMECGEWTYPFYYEKDDGCQYCGSNDVRQAGEVLPRFTHYYECPKCVDVAFLIDHKPASGEAVRSRDCCTPEGGRIEPGSLHICEACGYRIPFLDSKQVKLRQE